MKKKNPGYLAKVLKRVIHITHLIRGQDRTSYRKPGFSKTSDNTLYMYIYIYHRLMLPNMTAINNYRALRHEVSLN